MKKAVFIFTIIFLSFFIFFFYSAIFSTVLACTPGNVDNCSGNYCDRCKDDGSGTDRIYAPGNDRSQNQTEGGQNTAGTGCDSSCGNCNPGLSCQERGGRNVCWGSSCEPAAPPPANPPPAAPPAAPPPVAPPVVPPIVPPACPKKAQGDANCDGQTDSTDYFYYVAAVNGGQVPANVNPDFNGDGEVGLADRNIITKSLNP